MTRNNNTKDISVWLVPKKSQEAQLRDTIEKLASKYGSYAYIPHITIYYLADSMKPAEVVRVVKQEVSRTKPIEVEAARIEYSDVFTETLYIQYRKNKRLSELHERLYKRFSKAYKFKLNPHLSLLYKNGMLEEDKRMEAEQISYPKTLELNRIMVIVKEGSAIAEEKDVLDWKLVYEGLLSQ